MQGRMLVLFGLGAAAAVAGVLWWSVPANEEEEAIAALAIDEDGKAVDEHTRHRRLRGEAGAQARNLRFEEQDSDGDDAPDGSSRLRDNAADTAAKLGDGSIDRQDAQDGFDHVMTVLEDTARDHERLNKTDWQELYRAANDAFSALSMHLDAENPDELEQLEVAHRRLQDGLRRVKVRGRKFAPE